MVETLWKILEGSRLTGYHIIVAFFCLLTYYRRIDRPTGVLLSLLYLSNLPYMVILRFAPEIETVFRWDLTNMASMTFSAYNTILVLLIAARMVFVYHPLAVCFWRSIVRALLRVVGDMAAVLEGWWGGLWARK